MTLPIHPILQQSFAIIDGEIGEHSFSPEEYAIVQRVIHSTADFDFKHLIRFSPGAIEAAIAATISWWGLCPARLSVGV